MTPNGDQKNNKYSVRIASARVEKEFNKVPRKDYQKIRSEIIALANNPRPHGTKKLSDRVFRIRIGDYRVIYSIFDKEKLVLITKIAKRSESTYKDY